MDQAPEIPILTVTQFNDTVNQVLADMRVWVKGEISGYKVSQNKWVTFDLKDEGSKVNVFMTIYQVDQVLEDGMEVKVFGNPRIYVPYGKYSFTAQRVEPVGEGAQRRAFELTKQKLETEGLFDPAYKKELPRFPQTIGIVTSAEAAAYTDFLRILNNRWGGVTTILRPSLVQGNNAPGELVDAIEWFNKFHPVDVMVITRGGGSLEDLQAFNSEQVCRAIFASRIPIICGIGHERDTSLAELVADRRASTPSNAAEIAVPDKEEIQWQLQRMEKTMSDTIYTKLADLRSNLEDMLSRMESVLRDYAKTFQELDHRLKLSFQTYRLQLQAFQQDLGSLAKRIQLASNSVFNSYHDQLDQLGKLLTSYSPKLVLKRGYSIARLGNGKVATSVKQVKTGEVIQTEFADGSISSIVESKGKLVENGRLL